MMGELSNFEQGIYENCHLCPRNCGVDRTNGQLGFCQMGANIKVARAALHYWEEPCISGYGDGCDAKNGSGAVFFAGCNLRCVFCQNQEISAEGFGQEITVERLAQIFMELQEQGANNINLVTAVMFVPSVVEALKLAKANGLRLPVIYNCGGYESVETLQMLEGVVDVYLPDFKYHVAEHAKSYSKAADYPQVATRALAEMVRQQPEVVMGADGLIKRGVIVRHLLLPGCRDEAMQILDQLYATYQEQIYFSIMNQYTPVSHVTDERLKRKVTRYEYDKVIAHALDIGITKAYMQVGKTATESFIPAFDLQGVESCQKK